MTNPKASYLSPDRLQALISGTAIPRTAEGSALLADISGFTPVTERLRETLGARHGAEALAVYLNRVYDALIAEVDRHGGSIIGFAGDAITCWFSGDASAAQAVACGFALLAAMRDIERIVLPEGEPLLLGLKVAITTGTTKRFVVGDPEIQLIDLLAGAVVMRMATSEGLAQQGELLADRSTVERLGDLVQVREWRDSEQERFAILERLVTSVQSPSISLPDDLTLADDALLSEMLPPFARDLQAGVDAFPIELRPVTALFLRFTGIDYDEDSEAGEKLDRLMRLVQKIVAGYEGNVLQLTIGDKGSYLYAAFGAPAAHEDDPARALNAAVDIREQTAQLDNLDPLQIGISRGIMRTGAYGSATRRTYGALGDEVNLAARLMSKADPGTILISESLLGARLDEFSLESLPAIEVKGKARSIQVFRLIGRRDRSFEERFYTTPLVGRDDVLNQLQEAVQPIFEARHAGAIYIYGEAGMGKSRLAFEVQQRLQAETKVTWLIGQVDQLNRTPLSAFAYFLRAYFGQRRERDTVANLATFDEAFDRLLMLADETNRADLLLYRSFLAGIVGLVIPGSPYAMADEKLRIDNGIAALKAWARVESTRQPIVLQLEDAHWLDSSSVQAVQNLTYNMDGVPLALLLTSRYNDDGTPYTIPNIYSVPVHTFDLNRLTDDSVRAVAAAVLTGRISEELARFVGERAEGNPFFTEQLVLDLRERDALVESDSGWEVRTDAAAEVPAGVNAVLIARLDRLAAQVKTVVQTAAVLGREFDVMVLSRMLRDTEVPAIREAEREAIWSALDEIRYLFRHALLRDAAYAMQAQERLKTLHQLAAETIETLYANDETQYEALLEHWQNTEVTAKIFQYVVPVCERLVSITADYTRAESILQKTLSLGETPLRAGLLRLLGDAFQLRGDYGTAAAQYEACLTSTDNQAVQHIQALNGLSKIRMIQGNNAEAAALIERAMALARQHDRQAEIARIDITLGNLALRQGNNDMARSHYSESLRIARELDKRTNIVAALKALAQVESIKSNHAAASAYIKECLALASEMGDRQQMASAYNNLGTAALQQGDHQNARIGYENSLKIWREIGSRQGLGDAWSNLAILALRQGNLVEAQTYGEAGLRERRAIGDQRGIANSLSIVAVVTYEQLNYAAAQHYFEEILEMQRVINDRWGIATTLGNLGEIAVARGNFAEAQAYYSEALVLYRELDQPHGIANTITCQADIVQEQGDVRASRKLHEEALRLRREINDQTGIASSLVALADLDAQAGALQEAELQLNEALVILRELDHMHLSHALAQLAAVKRGLGQSSASVYLLLREALTLAAAKNSRRLRLLTLIPVTQVLFHAGLYVTLGEMIGLILANDLPRATTLPVYESLGELRQRLDAAALDAALERGRSLDLDTMIERLLTELS